MGQSGEVRECEGHSLCVTGTQECKFGREMVQVLCPPEVLKEWQLMLVGGEGRWSLDAEGEVV